MAVLPYRLVIFDLDGTLADSLPWFLESLNGVADRFGFRRVAPAELDELRRLGAREVVRRLQAPVWKLPFIARHMRRLAAENLHRMSLFPGATEMLRELKAAGVRTAVLSTNSTENIRAILGPDAALCADLAGGASVFGKAPKMRRLVQRAGLAPAQALAIGDEIRDLEAARAAGLAFGAVSWGMTHPEALAARQPEHLFQSMAEIAALFREAGAGQAGRSA